ncbi:MAG: nuclear transport factor 2 family protein [Planctomycetales bacterium]|nr:nuclear transport factor 2 family protein [Planctomycetales bacterium]
MQHSFVIWRAVAVTLLLVGNNARCQELTTDPKPIFTLLQQQVDCWNQGDIPGFMNLYWKSDLLTFSSGGDTVRGWQATFERYTRRYPDPIAMGKLTFTDLEYRPLGERAALVLGHWRLARGDTLEGNFSLVFQHIDGNWKIVHDHTSLKQDSND